MNKVFVFISIVSLFVCCSGGQGEAEWISEGEFNISCKTFLDPSGTNIKISGFENLKYGIALLGPDNIFYTEDGGNNWIKSENEISTRNFLNSLEICSDYVWATGGNAIRFSSDCGKTFKPLPDKGSLYRDALLSFCDSKSGWYAQLSENRFAKTNDGGSSWENFDVPGIGILKSIFLLNENCGYILDDKAVYKTADGGKSWRKNPLPGQYDSLTAYPAFEIGNAMRFENENEGTLVLRTSDPKSRITILRTKNCGISWEGERINLHEKVIPGSVFLSRDCRFLTVTDTINSRIYVYRRQFRH